jgi:two-component system chemotaxis response regulator CheY
VALTMSPRVSVASWRAALAPTCRDAADRGPGRPEPASTGWDDNPGAHITNDGLDNEDNHAAEGSEAPLANADVLVVDDESDVRWTVAEVLRSAGFSVAEAEDGEVAFDMLNTQHYRMVLLDIRMPKRDGVSLIEAVGEVPPVVVHSAYSLDAADRARLGSSVVDYLHKPVSPQKLLRAVEAVIGDKHE